MMIENGANVNTRDYGTYCLHQSLCCVNTIKLLLENGVDVIIILRARHDLIDLSSSKSTDEMKLIRIGKLLFEHGATIDLFDHI